MSENTAALDVTLGVLVVVAVVCFLVLAFHMDVPQILVSVPLWGVR